MKIQTVNVVEVNGMGNLSLTSFPDTKEGNVEAEKLFKQILSEQMMDDKTPIFSSEDIDIYTENGYVEFQGWECFLVHSQ